MDKSTRYGMDPDAPAIPDGLRPRPGVFFGCGEADCRYCYELDDEARPAACAKCGRPLDAEGKCGACSQPIEEGA